MSPLDLFKYLLAIVGGFLVCCGALLGLFATIAWLIDLPEDK